MTEGFKEETSKGRHVPTKEWRLYRVEGVDKETGEPCSFVGKEQNAEWAKKRFSKKLKNIRVYRVKHVPSLLEKAGAFVKEKLTGQGATKKKKRRKKADEDEFSLKEFLFG